MTQRVVLAYSGGLDTSVAVRWMRENWDVEVIACAVDVGQLVPGESEAIHERARAAGAVEVEVLDARADFARNFIVPALRANALYEGKYPLVSALSRPVIVEHLVASARRHRASAVAHGCTGKGNDQVRFEVSSRVLAPDLDVLAPVRVWGLTRADCVQLAGKWEIPIEATVEKLYSIDENMWGRAIECGVLENPWSAPPEEPFTLTRNPNDAPGESREIVVGFDEGVPVSLDGGTRDLVDLVDTIGLEVGTYGWGRIDMVENRRVGIKSREVYECPASLALIAAHQDLEGITLERDVAREKQRIEIRVAELIYDGLWHAPLMRALEAFVRETQREVTGEVRLRLEPGRCYPVGRRARRGLYDHDLATRTQKASYACGDSPQRHGRAAKGRGRAREHTAGERSAAVARPVR
jgi:argininosuccinate synthase